MKNGKGWHLEHTRHSEARLYGKASGGKVSAPKDPLKSAGNKKRFGVVKGRNVYLMDRVKTSPKKVAVQDLDTGDTAVISKQEVKNISNKFPTEKPKETYFKDGKELPLPSFAKKGKTYTMDGKKSTFLLLKDYKKENAPEYKKPKENIEFSRPYKNISREQFFKNEESGKREYDVFQVRESKKLKNGLYSTKHHNFNSLDEANKFLATKK
jgi:hypothetical protein